MAEAAISLGIHLLKSLYQLAQKIKDARDNVVFIQERLETMHGIEEIIELQLNSGLASMVPHNIIEATKLRLTLLQRASRRMRIKYAPLTALLEKIGGSASTVKGMAIKLSKGVQGAVLALGCLSALIRKRNDREKDHALMAITDVIKRDGELPPTKLLQAIAEGHDEIEETGFYEALKDTKVHAAALAAAQLEREAAQREREQRSPRFGRDAMVKLGSKFKTQYFTGHGAGAEKGDVEVSLDGAVATHEDQPEVDPSSRPGATETETETDTPHPTSSASSSFFHGSYFSSSSKSSPPPATKSPPPATKSSPPPPPDTKQGRRKSSRKSKSKNSKEAKEARDTAASVLSALDSSASVLSSAAAAISTASNAMVEDPCDAAVTLASSAANVLPSALSSWSSSLWSSAASEVKEKVKQHKQEQNQKHGKWHAQKYEEKDDKPSAPIEVDEEEEDENRSKDEEEDDDDDRSSVSGFSTSLWKKGGGGKRRSRRKSAKTRKSKLPLSPLSEIAGAEESAGALELVDTGFISEATLSVFGEAFRRFKSRCAEMTHADEALVILDYLLGEMRILDHELHSAETAADGSSTNKHATGYSLLPACSSASSKKTKDGKATTSTMSPELNAQSLAFILDGLRFPLTEDTLSKVMGSAYSKDRLLFLQRRLGEAQPSGRVVITRDRFEKLVLESDNVGFSVALLCSALLCSLESVLAKFGDAPDLTKQTREITATMVKPLMDYAVTFGILFKLQKLSEELIDDPEEIYARQRAADEKSLAHSLSHLQAFAKDFSEAYEYNLVPDVSLVVSVAVDAGESKGEMKMARRFELLKAIMTVCRVDEDKSELEKLEADLKSEAALLGHLASSSASNASLRLVSRMEGSADLTLSRTQVRGQEGGRLLLNSESSIDRSGGSAERSLHARQKSSLLAQNF